MELSYDQTLESTDFLGNNYEKIIEAFNHSISEKYMLSLEKTYFNCTKFLP